MSNEICGTGIHDEQQRLKYYLSMFPHMNSNCKLYSSTFGMIKDLKKQVVIEDKDLEYDQEGFGKNIELCAASTKPRLDGTPDLITRGIDVKFTNPVLNSKFMANNRAKFRTRLTPAQEDCENINRIYQDILAKMKAKHGDSLDFRSPLFNGTLEVGFPMHTVDDKKVPKWLYVVSSQSSSGHSVVGNESVEYVNNAIAHASPRSLEAVMNIWVMKKDGVPKGGLYFTARAIDFTA